jgi:hypothetical protein
MSIQPENQNSELARRAEALRRLLSWQHQVDLKGLLAIYPKDKVAKASILPGVLTAIICLLLYLAQVHAQSFLKEVVDSSLSILPNLLGFLLGGYTILIGFGDVELLKETTTLVEGRSISLFQMLSSIFALTIYIQSFTLAIAIVAHFTLLIPLPPKSFLGSFFQEVSPFVNIVAIPVFLFLLLYSILSLRDMVMNVFGFAQQYHLALTKERMSDRAKARREANKNSE